MRKKASLEIVGFAVALLTVMVSQALGQAPRANSNYTVYLSKYYTLGTPAALLVQFDSFNVQQTAAMGKLAGEGSAPPFVVIAAPSGKLEPTIPEGKRRGLRVENYDHVGPEFPNFLVEELIPEATKVENLSISTNVDLHMVSGGSSGGQCAFNACWYRNDYFRRAYIASPSFFALAGADEFFIQVQRCEPRPIRVYVTFNECEPVGYWGNNYEVGLATIRFLKLSGYEFMWQYFPETGHTWGPVRHFRYPNLQETRQGARKNGGQSDKPAGRL